MIIPRHDLKRRLRHTAATAAVIISSAPTAINISESGAEITWTLSRPATGQVHYGLTASYGSTTPAETSFDHSTHVQAISGLSESTEYHFKVVGTDSDSNAYDSGDFTFNTTGTPVGGAQFPSVIVTQQIIPLNSFAMPGVLQVMNDNVFGTQVTRLSNVSNSRNAYSTKPAWNSDGSLLALVFTAMLRGTDFTVLQTGQSWGDKFTWSAMTPTKAYAQHNSTQIRIYTVNTITGVMSYGIKTITALTGTYTAIDWGAGEGRTSKNDRFCFQWQKSGSTGIGVWDAETETVIWEYTIPVETSMSAIDWSKISWSGRYAAFSTVSNNGTGLHQGMWVRDTLSSAGFQVQGQQDHLDFGQDLAGNDWVGYRGASAWGQPHQGLWAMRCSTGVKKPLIPPALGMGHGSANKVHVSGTNFQRPGWFTISDAAGSYSLPTQGQIFNISIDDPTKIESFGQSHVVGSTDYLGEPKASVHPFGHQVVWGSRWQGNSTVYPFVASVDLGI